jgi:arylsulfatase A-like enzyme
MRRWLVALAGAALLADCSGTSARPPAARLVVLIAIDQLRPDRLSPELPGGLGRLMREGRVYANAFQDHAGTETCPGHVTLGTGRHPGPAGVPGNEFIDRASGALTYCVEDSASSAGVFGSRALGRSPRLIRSPGLGDWLKAAAPRSRVFSASAKDRSAIALAGQRPDGAYWLALDSGAGFTTSRWYASALPGWVEAFNGPGGSALLGHAPEKWLHRGDRPGAQPDDYLGESARFQRASGHPIRDADPLRALTQLYYTPFIDEITLEFAQALVEAEQLGRGPDPDLLAVSLSATDTVGHLYGPQSQEAADALERLDAALGRFLGWLEARVGRDRLLLALSADHGVLPLPERLSEEGKSQCAVTGGRIDEQALYAALAEHLAETFPPALEPAQRWFQSAGLDLTLRPETLAARRLSLEQVTASAEAFLERQPGVAGAWTAAEITRDASPRGRLYRNSFDPERSPDLVLEPQPTCLISRLREGTTHGSPHEYDRRVPLILFGNGIAPATVEESAATVDIAPTLAARIGVAATAEVDGRNLLAPKP